MIPVPYGLNVSVVIRREGDSAFVDVHAPLYQNALWTMPHSYAASFTDGQIVKDYTFATCLFNRYGKN
jgi:hypothetical protein